MSALLRIEAHVLQHRQVVRAAGNDHSALQGNAHIYR
jgi:hypothetical protein